MGSLYTADFETTTREDDCRVWAWGTCEIGKPDNFVYGNDIEGFFKLCKELNNPSMYFHNLKFDGHFILDWLLNNGFEWVKDKKDAEHNTFSTLISDMGMFLSLIHI